MPTNTCTNTRCDRPATHAVEFLRSSPIDPTPFTRLQCETHARRNVEQLGATMTDLPGVEADARPVVEGDALLDAARAYVARWRTVSRFTGAEPVGAVRVWYVGPSAARARDGQPLEAEFCEVVGAWELARELAPETGEVEAVTRCAGCGHDEVNLEVTFNLLADHMNDEAADGHTMTPAEVVESYADAHSLTLTEGDAAHLSARLADVARAIATFGPF